MTFALDKQGPPPEYTEQDASALFTPHSSGLATRKLSRPVALPQVDSKFDSPFCRAWAPALAGSGISQDDWLHFIEGLNIALIANPPLQVVDKVGALLGWAPSLAAGLAGAGMQIGAAIATHVTSKTLTDKYIKRNNRTFFKPRGLAVRLVKGRALKEMIAQGAVSSSYFNPKLDANGQPIKKEGGLAGFKAASTSDKLSTIGSGAVTVGFHLPIVRKVLHRAMPAAPSRAQLAPGSDMVDYRLNELAPGVAEIDRNVPPSNEQRGGGWLDQVSNMAVKKRIQKQADDAQELERMRGVLANRNSPQQQSYNNYGQQQQDPYYYQQQDPYGQNQGYGNQSGYPNYANSDGGAYLDKKAAKRREKDFKDQRKDAEKAAEKQQKNDKKADFKVGMADRNEASAAKGLMWLVVVNLDSDAIQDKDDEDEAEEAEGTAAPTTVNPFADKGRGEGGAMSYAERREWEEYTQSTNERGRWADEKKQQSYGSSSVYGGASYGGAGYPPQGPVYGAYGGELSYDRKQRPPIPPRPAGYGASGARGGYSDGLEHEW